MSWLNSFFFSKSSVSGLHLGKRKAERRAGVSEEAVWQVLWSSTSLAGVGGVSVHRLCSGVSGLLSELPTVLGTMPMWAEPLTAQP